MSYDTPCGPCSDIHVVLVICAADVVRIFETLGPAEKELFSSWFQRMEREVDEMIAQESLHYAALMRIILRHASQ